jgi:hypothetical protein
MYLDDGASRESAPSQHVPKVGSGYGLPRNMRGIGDNTAADKYCQVVIQQVWC